MATHCQVCAQFPTSTSRIRDDRSHSSPICWIVGIDQGCIYTVLVTYETRMNPVWTPHEPSRSLSSPAIYNGIIVTQIVLHSSHAIAIRVRFMLGLHPWMTTSRLSTFVLNSSKQTITLQIVSVHWRLIKFLLRINLHETPFTTFMLNAENRREKHPSVTGALVLGLVQLTFLQ